VNAGRLKEPLAEVCRDRFIVFISPDLRVHLHIPVPELPLYAGPGNDRGMPRLEAVGSPGDPGTG
jgi:hypothetical protein